MIASAPLASLFFITYDSMKKFTKDLNSPVSHMVSASCGEIMACFVRVPAEVIKQRTQVSNSLSLATFKTLMANKSGEGVVRGLYRGWNSTIMREIPFTVIQFPLYEYFKKQFSHDSLVSGAMCGSLAGGIAAALTTPLDVIKTRIMLNSEKVGFVQTVRSIVTQEGYGVFLHGIGPRTAWISAGGAVFLGCYETVKSIIA